MRRRQAGRPDRVGVEGDTETDGRPTWSPTGIGRYGKRAAATSTLAIRSAWHSRWPRLGRRNGARLRPPPGRRDLGLPTAPVGTAKAPRGHLPSTAAGRQRDHRSSQSPSAARGRAARKAMTVIAPRRASTVPCKACGPDGLLACCSERWRSGRPGGSRWQRRDRQAPRHQRASWPTAIDNAKATTARTAHDPIVRLTMTSTWRTGKSASIR